MEDKLIEYTDKIIEALESGIDFAGEQAPIFIQEVLTYAMIHHIIWILGFSIMFFICIYVTWCANIKRHNQTYMEDWGIGSFIAGLVSVIPLFGLISHISSLTKVIIAPRLYLIEKLTSLF